MYLHEILVSLWENPKIVSSLLMNTKPKEILNSLLPLFANNFYENILSQKFIQNNLLYVITLLLKHEIKTYCNLSFPKRFINTDSSCGYLLYELRNKRDFQIFLKDSIKEVVDILEQYPNDICFNIDKYLIKPKNKYEDEIIEMEMEGKLSEFILLNDKLIKKTNINTNQLEEIKKKYFSNIESNYDNKNVNEIVKEYYSDKFNLSSNNCLKNINEAINDIKSNNEIYMNYLYDFSIATNFIDTFLNKLIYKVNIIPYSIRVISKIISILIEKKYNNINKIKRNCFICKFFFGALFWPVSKTPNDSWFIGNYLISEQIINNIIYIEKIFYDFMMGELYINKEQYDYVPFNKFFIEKMDLLIKFIEELINVDLPEFINNTLEDDNYIFDYLKENENDGIINRSICFTIEDILDIIKNSAKKNDDIFLKNKKLKIMYENLSSSRNFEILCELDSKAKKENKLYFYLISDCLFAEQYEKKIKLNKKMNYFTLDKINNPRNEEEKNINIINEAKNLLSGLLFHLIILTKENISKECQNDIAKLLNELLILSKFSHYSFNEDIMTSWYIKPLINILPKLPKEMTNNNCQKLIEELMNDIKNSLKDLHESNGILNIINDEKIIYTQTTISFQDENIKLISGINSYKKALDIINKDSINIGFYIKNINNDIKFNLYQCKSKLISKYFDFKNYYYKNFKPRIFNTIAEFINEFPNFNILFKNSYDILEIEKKMDIPNQLKIYFIMINEYLNEKYKYINDQFNENKEKIYNNIKDKLYKQLFPEKQKEEINNFEDIDIPNKLKDFFNEININTNQNCIYSIKELNDINKEIYDYIMNKLNDKLYPKITTDEDKIIFVKACSHSWIELKHLDKKYQNRIIHQSFLLDIKKYFKLFIKEKSPSKKIEAMNYIYDIISKAMEFNEGKGEFGPDDITPILIFCFIKAQPYGIHSHLEYTLLYNFFYKSGKEDYRLMQLIQISEIVKGLSFKFFDNITEEEYYKNMIKFNK